MKTREALELAIVRLKFVSPAHDEAWAQLEKILTTQFPYLDVGRAEVLQPAEGRETEFLPDPTLDRYIDVVLEKGPCG